MTLVIVVYWKDQTYGPNPSWYNFPDFIRLYRCLICPLDICVMIWNVALVFGKSKTCWVIKYHTIIMVFRYNLPWGRDQSWLCILPSLPLLSVWEVNNRIVSCFDHSLVPMEIVGSRAQGYMMLWPICPLSRILFGHTVTWSGDQKFQ